MTKDDLQIPTHGLRVNGIASTASGAGPHPTLVILVHTPLLALTADDGLAPDTDNLVRTIQVKGGHRVAVMDAATRSQLVGSPDRARDHDHDLVDRARR